MISVFCRMSLDWTEISLKLLDMNSGAAKMAHNANCVCSSDADSPKSPTNNMSGSLVIARFQALQSGQLFKYKKITSLKPRKPHHKNAVTPGGGFPCGFLYQASFQCPGPAALIISSLAFDLVQKDAILFTCEQ